jgi:peptide/nickel transport system substrate-binding protein
VTEINVGDGPVAVAAGPGAVWVVNSQDASVWRIDPATRRVVATVTVGEGPSSVAIARDGVWVSNALSGTISRIDPAVDRVVDTVPVGGLPQAVVAGASTAYVAVEASGSAHRGGTLTVAVANPVGINGLGLATSLDPARGFNDYELLTLTNDGLVGYARTGGADSYRIVPDLALSLPTVTDGGRTYTFELRPGIRFSTGAMVRPADVRRGIERALLANGNTSYFRGIVGASGCLRRPEHCRLSNGIVTEPGSTTIVFHLSRADPDFLYKLALPQADAVPASTPLNASLPLPATGPYEIAGFDVRGGVIRLVRNPRFRLWSAAAQPDGFPDQIIERFGYTGGSAVRAVERGSADITSDNLDQTWSPALTSSLQQRYSSRLHNPTAAVAANQGVWLNTRLPPFDDIRVRQALSYAVDRNHLVDLAGGPVAAAVGCQLLPPDTEGYKPYCPYTVDPNDAGTYTGPDLATAKRLVAASGTEGQRVTVWFRDRPIGRRNGNYLVEVLRSLGYDATLRTVPVDAASTWRPGRQAGVGCLCSDFPSANDFFSFQLTCRSYDTRPDVNLNPAGFCNRRIDREIAHARALEINDPAAASRVWSAIDRQITLQAPWVVIRTQLAPDFVSRRTGNYTYCYLASLTGATGACLDQLWVH